MTSSPCFHLAIGSRFENIELVQAVLADTLQGAELADEDLYWVDIAVREAVANAIKHGNRQAPDKRVVIDLELQGGELMVRVRDEGEGFEPREVSDPLADENLMRTSGRGIFYMERFMDAVDYEFRPGGGTLLTLRKRVGGPAEPPPAASGSATDGPDH